METLFFFQLEWPEGKKEGKKKRVFLGNKESSFTAKKGISDLTRDALSPSSSLSGSLKLAEREKRKKIPDELLAIVAYHLALLEATWFVSLLLLLLVRR
jgi:hypothetical protein